MLDKSDLKYAVISLFCLTYPAWTPHCKYEIRGYELSHTSNYHLTDISQLVMWCLITDDLGLVCICEVPSSANFINAILLTKVHSFNNGCIFLFALDIFALKSVYACVLRRVLYTMDVDNILNKYPAFNKHILHMRFVVPISGTKLARSPSSVAVDHFHNICN